MDGSERIDTECDIRGFVTGRGGAGRSWSAKPGIAAAQTVEGVILDDTAYSAHREHGFQAIVNAV
jgi:hypothetical protein